MDLLNLYNQEALSESSQDQLQDANFEFNNNESNTQFFQEFSRKAYGRKAQQQEQSNINNKILNSVKNPEGDQSVPSTKRKQSNLQQKIERQKRKLMNKGVDLDASNPPDDQSNSENEDNDQGLPDIEEPENAPEAEEPAEMLPQEVNYSSPQFQGKSFASLGLIKHLLKAVAALGFSHPTPIQQMAIQPINSRRDVLASAVTGSGKTAAYFLPLIQRFYKQKILSQNYHMSQYTKALIIVPSRELAIQGFLMLNDLNKHTQLTSALIIGQSNIKKQEHELRKGPDFVIATPGRLIDHLMNTQGFNLEDLEVLVLDEADRLLELGFKHEITEIIQNSNPDRQTLLFSATLSAQLDFIIKMALRKPIRLKANPDNKMVGQLRQMYVKLKNPDDITREAVLLYLMKERFTEKSIIFFKTKSQCHRMAIIFGMASLNAAELHGNLTQKQRVESLMKFQQNEVQILLATDLAARGLDIAEIKTVINYEFPVELMRYIHRVGRTARAGKTGVSFTICDDQESKKLKKLMRKYNEKPELLKLDKVKIIQQIRMIKKMKSNIENVLRQELEEKEAMWAERDLQKAQNLMKYKDEIFNRPRRQWIISKEEKRKLNENVMKQLKLIPESGIKVKNEKNNKKAGGRQGRKQNRKFGKQKKIYGRKNF